MRTSLLCALLMLLPMAAGAQTYKCKSPDGKTSFQSEPCEPGSKGGPIVITDPSPSYDPPAPKSSAPPPKAGDKEPRAQRQLRAEEALRDKDMDLQRAEARNRQLENRNRGMACNAARHDLHAAQTPRPIYRVDDKGNRQFVEDANRDAEIAAAQKRVAENCGGV